MDVYTTEEEQLEAFRRWWKENGKSAVIGVLLGLGGVFGWRAWQAHVVSRGEAASVLYEQSLDALHKSDPDAARDAASRLEKTYADTAYATFARLILAKLAVDANDLDTAATHLRTALEHHPDTVIGREVRLRYARVLTAQGKYPEALAQLDDGDAGDYAAAYDELRGDIEVHRGNSAAARTAYERARNELPQGAPKNELLELKLSDLGPMRSP